MEIELTQGFKSIIDADDFERVSAHAWSILRPDGRIYARTNILGKAVYMHRFVLGAPPFDGAHSDHINGDTLDNRKSNLRWATAGQNSFNKKKHLSKISSQYKGVFYDKSRRTPWYARINANKKQIHLGYFKSEIAAAYAYNEGAQRFHGEFASLNDIR